MSDNTIHSTLALIHPTGRVDRWEDVTELGYNKKYNVFTFQYGPGKLWQRLRVGDATTVSICECEHK